ncbi:MAG: GFA family protein [Cupriavidus sp.]|nr:GFA family protein [Cupriavidus sp.]NUT15335.1 GFA family protein [Cupriavidus sp.]
MARYVKSGCRALFILRGARHPRHDAATRIRHVRYDSPGQPGRDQYVTTQSPFPAEGGCTCRAVRYRMATAPLFVHCCHCRWCQRETGASFALNAMIEADRVALLSGEPEVVDTPSASGQGQQIARCPSCHVAVWSSYAGSGPILRFVRVGTLDQPDLLPPDIHIYTASKQPWVSIPHTTPAVMAYYDREQYWPAASLARRLAILPQIEAYQAERRRRRP